MARVVSPARSIFFINSSLGSWAGADPAAMQAVSRQPAAKRRTLRRTGGHESDGSGWVEGIGDLEFFSFCSFSITQSACTDAVQPEGISPVGRVAPAPGSSRNRA